MSERFRTVEPQLVEECDKRRCIPCAGDQNPARWWHRHQTPDGLA
jgi:hypothetical protein